MKTFEEARGDIANRIGDQKLRGEREKYLDRLREQDHHWRNTELKKVRDRAGPSPSGLGVEIAGLNDELKTKFVMRIA